MHISICITVFNEERTIGPLLEALLRQTVKPVEIIVVDGGSTDKTVEIIRHFQKKDRRLKLLREKCSRARGRNLAVEVAKGEIIVMTDAGCLPRPDWLEKITQPLIHLGGAKAHPRGVRMDSSGVDIAAGFYRMTYQNSLGKAARFFLGVMPADFDAGFLPSTRSIAFKKTVWEKVGGFDEKLPGAAEDTLFNYKLLKAGKGISRVKDAVVEWGMPETVSQFMSKIKNYAKGDAETKIWLFPGKGLASHNIKALFIFIRYLLGFSFLLLTFYFHLSPIYLFICLFVYLIRAYRKVYLAFGDWQTALWGPVLQITSDVAVIEGFASGIIS